MISNFPSIWYLKILPSCKNRDCLFVRALPLIRRFIWNKLLSRCNRQSLFSIKLILFLYENLLGHPLVILKRRQMILKITFAFAGRMVSKGNQQGLWRSWIASYLTFRPLLSHHSLRWRRSFGSRKIPIGKADACNREKSDESTAKRTWAPSGTWERDLERFFPKFNTLL